VVGGSGKRSLPMALPLHAAVTAGKLALAAATCDIAPE
jgi:hypothetical protein